MPSPDERTTWDPSSGNDAEEPVSDGSEQRKAAEERGALDAPSAPEPSWQPETPAWDRPTPRSETTAMPLGGPMDGAATDPATTRLRRSTTARKAATAASTKAATRKRSAARKTASARPATRKSTTRKSPKRVAAGKKAAASRKRKTARARKTVSRRAR